MTGSTASDQPASTAPKPGLKAKKTKRKRNKEVLHHLEFTPLQGSQDDLQLALQISLQETPSTQDKFSDFPLLAGVRAPHHDQNSNQKQGDHKASDEEENFDKANESQIPGRISTLTKDINANFFHSIPVVSFQGLPLEEIEETQTGISFGYFEEREMEDNLSSLSSQSQTPLRQSSEISFGQFNPINSSSLSPSSSDVKQESERLQSFRSHSGDLPLLLHTQLLDPSERTIDSRQSDYLSRNHHPESESCAEESNRYNSTFNSFISADPYSETQRDHFSNSVNGRQMMACYPHPYCLPMMWSAHPLPPFAHPPPIFSQPPPHLPQQQ